MVFLWVARLSVTVNSPSLWLRFILCPLPVLAILSVCRLINLPLHPSHKSRHTCHHRVAQQLLQGGSFVIVLNESFLMSVFLYVVFLCLKYSLHPPLCRSDLCSSFTPQPTRVFQEEASLHPPLPCTSEVAASALLRELSPQPIQSSRPYHGHNFTLLDYKILESRNHRLFCFCISSACLTRLAGHVPASACGAGDGVAGQGHKDGKANKSLGLCL